MSCSTLAPRALPSSSVMRAFWRSWDRTTSGVPRAAPASSSTRSAATRSGPTISQRGNDRVYPMSEFNPLVERVDALLKRHHQQQQENATAPSAPAASATVPQAAPAIDDDIPVLTEIINADSIAAASPALHTKEFATGIEDAVLEKLLA